MNPSYRWTIVAAGALMTCVAIGAMFSLAVFLQPITVDTGWSRASVSAAMTLNFLVMGAGGFVCGTISDRFWTRIRGLIGGGGLRAACLDSRPDVPRLLRGALGPHLPHGELRHDVRHRAHGRCQHLQRRRLS